MPQRIRAGWDVPMLIGAPTARVEGDEVLAWNSALDSGLDSVEYSVYQASELTASTDWDYSFSALEDESLRAQDKA